MERFLCIFKHKSACIHNCSELSYYRLHHRLRKFNLHTINGFGRDNHLSYGFLVYASTHISAPKQPCFLVSHSSYMQSALITCL